MRKLVVAFSAVAMVALGASVAQAQGTEKCPAPETLKFEQPFQVGQTQGGITITATGPGDTVTFSIGNQVTVTEICVKAGNTAPVFTDFPGTTSTMGGITLTYSCTFPGANTGASLVGPCTVTITGGGPGLGISHVTFYTTAYPPPEAAVAPLTAAQGGVGAGGAAAAPALAFTGVQLPILLAIVVGLLLAGTLAWTVGRRRARAH